MRSFAHLKGVWSREEIFALQLSLALSGLFALLVFLSGENPKVITLFPIVALLALVVSNFGIALAFLVISLFLDFQAFGFSSSVLFTVPFGFAFLLRFRDIGWRAFSNPLSFPILVYGLCIIPSFANVARPLTSLYMLFNVAAFLIVVYGLVAAARDFKDVRYIAAVFFMMVLLNSLLVYAQALSGVRRPFGFSGVMFVDYSALGVCAAVAIGAASKGKQRLLFFMISAASMVALLLTQTRSTLIACIATLAILAGYLLFHSDIAEISRKRLAVAIATASLVLGGLVVAVFSLNPRIEERATELTESGSYEVTPSGGAGNSLITRLLIWDTALDAFRSHPVVGIGVYSFPFASRQYYTIPKVFYDLYVEGLSPHQTHLAVLVETGIVGAMGFTVFLVAALRIAWRSVRIAVSARARKYAFVGAVGFTYCMLSMVVTDAWLRDQGIVLLGLVIGGVLAIRKINSAVLSET